MLARLRIGTIKLLFTVDGDGINQTLPPSPVLVVVVLILKRDLSPYRTSEPNMSQCLQSPPRFGAQNEHCVFYFQNIETGATGDDFL